MPVVSPEQVIAGLIARGAPPHIAQGVTARLHGESRLDTGINEINPTVEGSRGGYGLAQWTGPRRRQYEAFAAERGAALDDLDTQLDFLMWENANTEKSAWGKVLQAKDPVEAARLFTTEWERPGTPHLEATLETARKFAGLGSDYAGGAATGTYAPGTQGQAAQSGQNPARLAWAYANGKMTPEDAAMYEQGMAAGVFPQADKPKFFDPGQQPDPASIYAATAMRQRQPFQPVPLNAGLANATPWRA